MNPLGKPLLLALCSLASLSPISSRAEDLRLGGSTSNRIWQADSLSTQRQAMRHPLLREAGRALPLLAVGMAYNLYNEPMRALRYAHVPTFRNRYDDYLQFAPLALQVGMRLSGIKGASHSLTQMMLSDAIASGLMLSVVYAVKTSSHVLRPDGSSHNSYPSGHTAMAFTAATLLSQEYGSAYPWLSALSYTAASAVGVGRMLNNRHWVGDVVSGAALGYLSGKVGYWLSNLIYRGKYGSAYAPTADLLAPSLSVYIPMAYASASHLPTPSSLLRAELFSAGLGIHWAYHSRGYFVRGEVGAETSRLVLRQGEERHEGQTKAIALSASWGYAWHLLSDRLALEADMGLRLRLPEVVRSLGNLSLSTQTSIAPMVRLSPRWQITPHVALKVDATAEYCTKSLRLWGNGIDHRFALPYWSIGSSLAFRL